MAATAIDLQPNASPSDVDCQARIAHARQAPGDRVVILGHHYQRDETFRHADESRDSLRLWRHAADSKAECISPMVRVCSTMFRIDPQHLARVLQNLVDGNVVNRISVPADVPSKARVALQRMLDI